MWGVRMYHSLQSRVGKGLHILSDLLIAAVVIAAACLAKPGRTAFTESVKPRVGLCRIYGCSGYFLPKPQAQFADNLIEISRVIG